MITVCSATGARCVDEGPRSAKVEDGGEGAIHAIFWGLGLSSYMEKLTGRVAVRLPNGNLDEISYQGVQLCMKFN